MAFDEVTESVGEKRNFLLNRVMQKKLLPDDSGDDEEAEKEVEATVWYIELDTWFLWESVIVGFCSLFVRSPQDELLQSITGEWQERRL